MSAVIIAGVASPAIALACNHKPVHTPKPSPTPVHTVKPSCTPTPKPSATPVPTPVVTPTPKPSTTPTPSASPTPSPTPTPVVVGGQGGGSVQGTSTVATTLPQTGHTTTALQVALAAGLAAAGYTLIKREWDKA